MNRDKLTKVPLYEKKISEDIYNNIATIIWDNVEKEREKSTVFSL